MIRMRNTGALLLALSFIITILSPTSADAVSSGIATLSDLKTAFSEGGSYTLDADIAGITESLTMYSGELTVDLNGHTLSGSSEDNLPLMSIQGGSMTITDSLGGGGVYWADYYGVYVTGGTLTIRSGEFSVAGDGYSAVMFVNGAVDISGGSFSGDSAGLSVAGGAELVSVSGGAFTAAGDDPEGGVCVFEGGDGKARPSDLLAEGYVFSICGFSCRSCEDGLYWATAPSVTVSPGDAPMNSLDMYEYGMFSDVDESLWYGADCQNVIGTVFELGIMAGVGGGLFDPSSNLTVSGALKMACVVRDRLNGSDGIFDQIGEWYQVYVEYALSSGIINDGDFNDYERYVTRAEMAYIFTRCAPEGWLYKTNEVTGLPDVTTGTAHYTEIISLYESGILIGVDAQGTYLPGSPVSRAEAAAIISRVALPTSRQAHAVFDAEAAVTPGPAEPEPSGFDWDTDYYPGVYLSDYDSLLEALRAAAGNLVTEFKVRIPKAMYISGELSGAMQYGMFNEYYSLEYWSDAGGGMTLVFSGLEYTLYAEVEAVIANPSIADRASGEALAYYERIAQLLDTIPLDGLDDAGICLALHDYLILNYDYDNGITSDPADPSYSFAGLLDYGSGVCQAYMELFDLLADMAGIDSHEVIGSGFNEDHGWNYVIIDGTGYHIDVTWDDPGQGYDALYTYFMVDENVINQDHVISGII